MAGSEAGKGFPRQRTDLTPGPALVMAEAPLGLPYRGGPAAGMDLVAGTRSSCLAERDTRIAVIEARALSACAVLGAPMLALVARGIAP